MKKSFIAIASVGAVIAFPSCENLNEDFEIGGAEEVVIDASVAEQTVDTKSVIDEFGNDKVTYKWLAGDAICVFFGDSEGSIFVTDVTASKAKFKGTIGAVMGGGDDLTDETSLWGVYPFDKNTSCDGSSITLTLPHEQGAAAETFADDLFPSIARSTNFTMAFYPVCGSIRFKVSDPEIVKVTLSGNNGEDLAGKATVSMPLGGTPAVDVISEGQKELVMNAPDGGCFDTSKYYYFVMYPTDFTKGLTITYYKEDEKASYVLNSSVKVRRNRFTSATNKDSGLTYSKITSDYDYIDEYGINQGPGIEIDGVVWAPVNCGYKARTFDALGQITDKGYTYGKLYQWGRKFGQGYTLEYDNSEPILREGPISLAEGQDKNNEDIIYSGNYDWLDFPNGQLWNLGTEDAPIKTEYDPCPEGWRVPTITELDGLIQNRSGWTKDANGHSGQYLSGSNQYDIDVPQIFLPEAGGHFIHNQGIAHYRGNAAYYWSSTIADTYSRALDFFQNTFREDAYARLDSRSIRCVKNDGELIPVSFVEIGIKSLSLSIGESSKLSVDIIPLNANHKQAYWYSSNNSVVVIDQSGMITAVAEGTATITAMAGMKTTICQVNVSSEEIDLPSEAISITKYQE